jgi:2,3-dihydroxybenzoate decarboxylase
MKKKDRMSRKEFLGKTALSSLTLPIVLEAASKTADANGPAPGKGKGAGLKMGKIALEEHWGTKEILEVGERWRRAIVSPTPSAPQPQANAPTNARLARLWDFEEFRLPLMDQFGIAMQVLALSSPGIQAYSDAEAAEAIAMAKKLNDQEAEIIRKYPSRFAGFANLPTQDPRAAADELERAVSQLGFKGAMIQGHTNWEYLDADKYRVLWERVGALEVPVYLHVNESSEDAKKAYAGRPELLGPTWAYTAETAVHALRIITSGVFDAYPKASLILGHLGESLPYLLGRIDEGYGYAVPPGAKKLKKMPSEYIRENLFVTTSGLYKPEALQCAIAAMGADRVFFAVDYPFVDPKSSVPLFDSTPMSAEVREMVSYRNAEKWLKLT